MSVVKESNRNDLLKNLETMTYRPLGRTGLEVSSLSMGCMRLGEDQEVNTATVKRAIELGVNYFETTRFYCGGQCQQRTAPGLVGHQHEVIASGKSACSPDETAFGYRKEIERQLDIMGLTHFKFYQVGWFSWGMMPHLLKRGGVLEAIRKAKDDGLVHHVGFTGHDTPENFIKCIETGLFDSITVPYNMINRMYEPTIERAGELGVGVVAMCPVSGGILSGESSQLKEAVDLDLPTTEMALHFVLANPNVSTACSGMTTPEMVEENAKSVCSFDVGQSESIQEQVNSGLARLRETLGEKQCTGCGYCMPCPQEVNIPLAMELYRNWKAYGLHDAVAERIAGMPKDGGIYACNRCGACIEKCPNDIPVPDVMDELVSEFGHYDPS